MQIVTEVEIACYTEITAHRLGRNTLSQLCFGVGSLAAFRAPVVHRHLVVTFVPFGLERASQSHLWEEGEGTREGARVRLFRERGQDR